MSRVYASMAPVVKVVGAYMQGYTCLLTTYLTPLTEANRTGAIDWFISKKVGIQSQTLKNKK